jgi:hypothetical protein
LWAMMMTASSTNEDTAASSMRCPATMSFVMPVIPRARRADFLSSFVPPFKSSHFDVILRQKM